MLTLRYNFVAQQQITKVCHICAVVGIACTPETHHFSFYRFLGSGVMPGLGDRG
ncbi:hypothetical protein QUB70_13275 [Microcoleus sp. A003_D6]